MGVSWRTLSPGLVGYAQSLAVYSVHSSKRELKQFLLDYIAKNNENPRPFVWTKGPEKLQRIIAATKQYQATHPRKPRRRRRKGSRRTANKYN